MMDQTNHKPRIQSTTTDERAIFSETHNRTSRLKHTGIREQTDLRLTLTGLSK